MESWNDSPYTSKSGLDAFELKPTEFYVDKISLSL